MFCSRFKENENHIWNVSKKKKRKKKIIYEIKKHNGNKIHKLLGLFVYGFKKRVKTSGWPLVNKTCDEIFVASMQILPNQIIVTTTIHECTSYEFNCILKETIADYQHCLVSQVLLTWLIMSILLHNFLLQLNFIIVKSFIPQEEDIWRINSLSNENKKVSSTEIFIFLLFSFLLSFAFVSGSRPGHF